MGAIQSPYLALGLPTGPAGGDLSGAFPNPTVTGLHVSTVQTAPVTITGTTAETLALGGPTIASGGLYAGLSYDFEGSGVVTTTVSTQTAAVVVRLGGVGGTVLLSTNITPNSSGVVTGAEFGFSGWVVFNTPTQATVSIQINANFFPSTVNQGQVAVTNASAQQLVVDIAPSATAETYLISAGKWTKAN